MFCQLESQLILPRISRRFYALLRISQHALLGTISHQYRGLKSERTLYIYFTCFAPFTLGHTVLLIVRSPLLSGLYSL